METVYRATSELIDGESLGEMLKEYAECVCSAKKKY